jgi:hypothetical protein
MGANTKLFSNVWLPKRMRGNATGTGKLWGILGIGLLIQQAMPSFQALVKRFAMTYAAPHAQKSSGFSS